MKNLGKKWTCGDENFFGIFINYTYVQVKHNLWSTNQNWWTDCEEAMKKIRRNQKMINKLWMIFQEVVQKLWAIYISFDQVY